MNERREEEYSSSKCFSGFFGLFFGLFKRNPFPMVHVHVAYH